MTITGEFDLAQPRAQKSGPAALFAVAESCRHEQEYAAALTWYLRAAEAGYAPAQNDYATMLLNGVGTERDPDEAVFWYRQAAGQGLAIAQYNLATRYRIGESVPLDLAEAARWMAKAAAQGCMEALCDLGVMHRFGHGVPRDLGRAAELLVAAATGGDVTAIGNLADIAADLALLAGQGDSRAREALGRMRELGLGAEITP
jgi:TPR repeat protein